MVSIKVANSTVRCDDCDTVHEAEDCTVPLDIIAWGCTSHNNLRCPDCTGEVSLEDAERLHPKSNA